MASTLAQGLLAATCPALPPRVTSSRPRSVHGSFALPPPPYVPALPHIAHCQPSLNPAPPLGAVRPGFRAVRCAAGGQLAEVVAKKNAENAVIVYSKSWCPYCGQVKGLFRKLGVEAKIIELDQLVEERALQDALFDLTGQSTVPNVFIGGKHIGGCDATVALHSAGKLIPLLEEAGVKLKSA